jgi:protein MpaA
VFGRRGNGTKLVFAGFHGDEPKGVSLANRLIEALTVNQSIAGGMQYIIVPTVNPDGLSRRSRRNARGIDINRNFPTRNWEVGTPRNRMFGGQEPASEPETRVVIQAIKRYKPDAIITIHSISGGRHCNNFDGPAEGIARAMNRHNGYPVTPTIGYPTPGSFGTWAGIERSIPTVTLELPTAHSLRQCWSDNCDALLVAP